MLSIPGGLMMLNAGSTLHHEVRTLGRDPSEGYHVYFRPKDCELDPMAQFLPAFLRRVDEWRLLASCSRAPVLLRTHARVHDGHFRIGLHDLPRHLETDVARLLIIFEGRVRFGTQQFRSGDVLALGDTEHTVQVVDAADLLLIGTESLEALPRAGVAVS